MKVTTGHGPLATIHLEQLGLNVQPGDLLGFSWKQSLGIPYDYTLYCEDHRILYRYVRVCACVCMCMCVC